jgi:hypothetical protein
LLAQLLGITITMYRLRLPVVPREDLFVSGDPLSPAIFTELQQLDFESLGMLWTRMKARTLEEGRMPRVAALLVDDKGVKLIGDWIRGLPGGK